MQGPVLVFAVLLATSLFAGERMTVSVCTRGRLDERTVAAAEAAASALFHSIDVDVLWAKCDIGLEGDEAAQQHWFTLRLRDGRSFMNPAPPGLDTLGQAFLLEDNGAYIIEVYYEQVQTLAVTRDVEFAALLGSVIAHELGHLLLGPAHSPQGVMSATLDSRSLEAIRQGRQKFTPADGVRIRRVLHGSGNGAPTAR